MKGNNFANRSCRDVWNEYHEMGVGGIKAVADYKAFTVESVLELLQFVAPRMMKRGSAHYSYGIADNLDDEKYKHYKYWSNPLQSRLDTLCFYSAFGLPSFYWSFKCRAMNTCRMYHTINKRGDILGALGNGFKWILAKTGRVGLGWNAKTFCPFLSIIIN